MRSVDDVVRRRMAGLGLRTEERRTPAAVVESLLAMQAQEHRYARWSVAQRCGATPASASEVDAAFDAGEIVRTHVLRPTWHYVARRDLRWLMRLSGPAIVAGNGRRYAQLDLDSRTLVRGAEVMAEAVRTAGPLTRRALGEALGRAGIGVNVERLAHLVMHAELTSVLCSGPMEGRQHTYASFDDRVPADPGPEGEEALAELARRYFSTRGPATAKDLAWWAGLKVSEAQAAIRLVDDELERLDLDGRTYHWTGGGSPAPDLAPRVDLVQCYDETIISFSESRDVLQTPDVSFAVPGRPDAAGYIHVVLLRGGLLGHWRAGASRVEVRTARTLDRAEEKAVADAVHACLGFAGW